MSNLTDLAWRRILRGSIATVTNGLAEVLNGIYLSIQTSVTTNYDGSARSNGVTASEFTVAGPLTEAVYWSYNVGALTHKSIIGGKGAALPAATMRTPDTNLQSVMMAQITKNAGAFNAWDNANPFTSGQNFNYWLMSNAVATAETWQWDFYESKEAAILLLQRVLPTVGSMFGLITGAYIDPHSTSLLDAESDGRIYGQCVGTSGIVNGFFTNTGGTGFLDHSVTANTNHHGSFDPGLSTISTAERAAWRPFSADPLLRNGDAAALYNYPVSVAGSFYLGTLRGMGPGRSSIAGAVLQSGGVDVAYVAITNSFSVSAESLYLKY